MATIVRVAHRRDPYVVIDRRAVEDERLTWAARGVLGYLLAKPDDWSLQIEDLRRRGDLGRGGLYTVLRQLQHLGYVTREQHRDSRGRLTETIYTVFEVPGTVLPLPAPPDAAEPDTAVPDTAEPTLPSNQYTKEPKEQVTTTTEAEQARSDRAGEGGAELYFPPLSDLEVAEAKKRLAGLPTELAQQLLDELAGRMRADAVHGPPLAYLRGLVRRADAGQFTPEVGPAIGRARARRARTERAVAQSRAIVPDLPPADPNSPIARRVAEIRARERRSRRDPAGDR